MQAEGVDVAPSWSTPAGFHSRAAAVFGSLPDGSASAAAPTWSLQQEQVFRPGKGADYSSEEEEEDAKEIERRRTELLPTGMLDLDGALFCSLMVSFGSAVELWMPNSGMQGWFAHQVSPIQNE